MSDYYDLNSSALLWLFFDNFFFKVVGFNSESD